MTAREKIKYGKKMLSLIERHKNQAWFKVGDRMCEFVRTFLSEKYVSVQLFSN